MKKVFLLAILSVLVVAGCSSQTISRNDYNNSYKPPAGTPSLEILRPLNGDAINSSIISIKINVTNFQLVDVAANRTNVENQGYVIYVLDEIRAVKSVYKDYSIANVAPGRHTLMVELRNNDNTPLSPPVKKSVTVSVTG